MANQPSRAPAKASQAGGKLNLFERYLTLWVFFCILAGIVLGRFFPGIAEALDP